MEYVSRWRTNHRVNPKLHIISNAGCFSNVVTIVYQEDWDIDILTFRNLSVTQIFLYLNLNVLHPSCTIKFIVNLLVAFCLKKNVILNKATYVIRLLIELSFLWSFIIPISSLSAVDSINVTHSEYKRDTGNAN